MVVILGEACPQYLSYAAPFHNNQAQMGLKQTYLHAEIVKL